MSKATAEVFFNNAANPFEGSGSVRIWQSREMVKLSLGRVEDRLVYDRSERIRKPRWFRRKPQPRDTWSVEGSILRGLLDMSYNDPAKREPPTLLITVVDAQSERYEPKPIWDPELKERVLERTDRIAKALM